MIFDVEQTTATLLSENTVKGYTRGVYSKLCVHSKQELLDMLERAGHAEGE